MGRPKKKRRSGHGSAWRWKQTDCWYYTPSGTRKRAALFDEQGERIRGVNGRAAAERALAKIKLANAGEGSSGNGNFATEGWSVARVCSDYLQYCEQRVGSGGMSRKHHDQASAFLNDLCGYCGALSLAELKKSHIQTWIERHAGWRSQATHRSVIAIVQAAFNRAEERSNAPNPLKGLKRPAAQPRLHSLSATDEQSLYEATDEPFKNFLFSAIHTGLRPFCELARLTAEHVEVVDRGMQWRVYSSKTKKTRKIPVQDAVAKLVRGLLATAPKGSGKPLFRNSHGNPWTNSAGVMRFLAIKKKLGWDLDPVKRRYSCYTCRHTFAHRMLSGYWNDGAGCSIEVLAELLGDTPKVAFEHYGKEWGQHYQEPLWAAIGLGAPKRSPDAPSANKRSDARSTKRPKNPR